MKKKWKSIIVEKLSHTFHSYLDMIPILGHYFHPWYPHYFRPYPPSSLIENESFYTIQLIEKTFLPPSSFLSLSICLSRRHLTMKNRAKSIMQRPTAFSALLCERQRQQKKKIRLAGDRERTRSFGAFEIRRAIPPSPRRSATNHNHIARARVEKCHCRLG